MNRDPRVDAYLRRVKPFARPILRRLRTVIRSQVTGGTETVKWGMPAYERHGRIVCGFAGFTAHCALWFWNSSKLKKALPRRTGDGAMGNFGKISSGKDQPSRPALVRALRAAVALNSAAAKR